MNDKVTEETLAPATEEDADKTVISEDSQTPESPHPLDFRSSAMADIVKNAREGREDAPIADEEAPPPDDTPKLEEKPAPVVEDPKPEMVSVRVRKEIFEVPQADIDEAGGVKAYQMNRAAESYMEEAKELLKTAKEGVTAPVVPDTPENAGPVGLSQEQSTRLEALTEEWGEDSPIVTQQRSLFVLENAAQQPNDIVQIATQKALETMKEAEQTRETEEAVTAYQDQYGHIANDEGLDTIATLEFNKVVDEDPNISVKDAMLEAGKRVDEKYVKAQGGARTRKVLERKQNQATPPTGANARIEPKPAEKVKTGSDIVAQMRADRGLPTY